MRDKWEFPYPADKLATAAQAKSSHHLDRLAWWQMQKAETVAKIKLEGLEIDDSLVEKQRFSNSYGRDTTVNIKTELLRDLNECIDKIREHRGKAEEYGAWVQVLKSQGQASLPLNKDDWMFFFSAPVVDGRKETDDG